MNQYNEHRQRADRYFGHMFGVDSEQARSLVTVAVTDRRTRHEEGYGNAWPVLALSRESGLWLSLAPSAESLAEVLAGELRERRGRFAVKPSQIFVPSAQPPAAATIEGAEIRPIHAPVPSWGGGTVPTESIAQGTAFGVYLGSELAAWAEATPLPQATARFGVLLVGIETHPEYRRQGYARAVLTRLTEEAHRRDLTPVYFCGGNNVASQRTALAAGYVPYGEWWRIRATDLAS